MKTESKDTDLSLYCKQRSIESWHELPWACGFASIVTAMRLLGDRATRADQLPRRLRRMGGNPRDGIDENEVVRLVREFGYAVRSCPRRDRNDPSCFKDWLVAAWRRHHPTVVACGGGDEHDHYICAYSNPDDDWVWVMDPLENEEVYSSMRWRDFLDWTGDTSGEFWEWEGHEIVPRGTPGNALPPSTRLFEWVNELPGDVDERDPVAAAFIDNLFDVVRPFSTSRHGTALSSVLDSAGPLQMKLDEWAAYYDAAERAAVEAMVDVARDLDAHMSIRVDAATTEALAAELALLLVHSLKFQGELEEAA